MPDAPQQAARLTDPVGHGLGIVGMLAGAMLGAVVGAILVLGAIATGGALLIALAVCAAAASIGGAGLAGGQIARALQHACGLPNPTTGALASVGSPNIFIGNKPAARALADMAAACSGLGGVVHFPIPMAPIADGAKTVKFNNLYAARVTSKLVCAAEITMGEPTVVIGGPTIRVLEVTDIEAMLEKGLTYLMWGGIIGAGIVSCFRRRRRKDLHEFVNSRGRPDSNKTLPMPKRRENSTTLILLIVSGWKTIRPGGARNWHTTRIRNHSNHRRRAQPFKPSRTAQLRSRSEEPTINLVVAAERITWTVAIRLRRGM